MNLSYDYEDLLKELKQNLSKGTIRPTDVIKIVRSERAVYENYYPIVNCYYTDKSPETDYELAKIEDILKEMTYHNPIK